MATGDAIRLGVIGCGGFGLFALQQFVQAPAVKLVAMAGTQRPAAEAAAKRFGVPDIVEVERLVADPEVDVVYIATPPFLHYRQALAALGAGKHVICEKPLAMEVAEADELIARAGERDRLLVANLMQRYNPLFTIIRRLIGTKVLGEVLHGYFENYASDESLPLDHWFWDRGKSGGIFIEHGVHFFDLFSGWLGEGEVVAAQGSTRPGTSVEDQVQCTVRYGDSVLVNFYHGFHQPGRFDRQEIRLVFERGDVTLFDWVPTRLRICALLDEQATRTLCDLLPGATLDVTAAYGGSQRACRGRGKPLDVAQAVEIRWGPQRQKLPLYCQLLRAMIEDHVDSRPRPPADGQPGERPPLAGDGLRRRSTGADVCSLK